MQQLHLISELNSIHKSRITIYKFEALFVHPFNFQVKRFDHLQQIKTK